MKDYTLFNAVKKEVAEGRVRESILGDLRLFKYTETCANDRVWNDCNKKCRGLIMKEDGTIIARPFSKFFNLQEMPETQVDNLPTGSYEIAEKLDGSCLTLFYYDGKWQGATPGSFVSEQAIVGTKMLENYNLEHMPKNVTPVLECIYPANRIVVSYANEHKLVLLAINELNGEEWHSDRVDQIAEKCGFPRPIRYNYSSLLDLPFPDNFEGYVVKFENGLRVKIKSPLYVKIHRLLNYMTPKNVIELMRGREYRATLEQLPTDLQAAMDDIRAAVQTAHYNHMAAITAIFNAAPVGERKAFALWAKAHAPVKYLGALFSLLDGKDIEDFVWKIVLEEIKNE